MVKTRAQASRPTARTGRQTGSPGRKRDTDLPEDQDQDPELPPEEKAEDEEWVDLCAICLHVKRNPVKISCDHSFCKSCYETFLKFLKGRIAKCPICRRTIKRRSFRRTADSDSKEDADADLCAFCLEPIRDAVQLQCKHSFCRTCLALYREARDWRAKRCPLCRRSLNPYRYQQLGKAVTTKDIWQRTLLLSLALFLLSFGPFFLLLIYW